MENPDNIYINNLIHEGQKDLEELMNKFEVLAKKTKRKSKTRKVGKKKKQQSPPWSLHTPLRGQSPPHSDFMLSKAFSQSSSSIMPLCPLLSAYSCSLLAMNIASIVLLCSLKPYCVFMMCFSSAAASRPLMAAAMTLYTVVSKLMGL